jgi:hypothetical protein
MAELKEQLAALKSGKSRRIRGMVIHRDGDYYVIDGDAFTLQDAVSRLASAENKLSHNIDYNWTAFLEKTPSGVLVRWFRCRDRAEHAALVDEVKNRGRYLWYAQVRRVDDRYQAVHPHLIDWDSVPDHPQDNKTRQEKAQAPDPSKWDGGLSCPFCRRQVSSTPGRTLHVKHDHPERLEEYFTLIAVGLQKRATPESDEDDDVVSRVQESASCPFCEQITTSISGRTLHVKGKHPERFAEYRQMAL